MEQDSIMNYHEFRDLMFHKLNRLNRHANLIDQELRDYDNLIPLIRDLYDAVVDSESLLRSETAVTARVSSSILTENNDLVDNINLLSEQIEVESIAIFIALLLICIVVIFIKCYIYV